MPEDVRASLFLLYKTLEASGPVIAWKNFAPLKQLGAGNYHGHLKSGRPTYVACWRVTDKRQRQMEVFYAGTHEKAPY